MPFINDGFSTTVSLATTGAIFGVVVNEKTVTPPGAAGGGPIPITTMRNINFRTNSPKTLVQLDPMTLTVAYDPLTFNSAFPVGGFINLNQEITVNFPDGSSLVFFGFVDEFKPQEMREGEQPLASMTIVPSLINLSGVETFPTFNIAP